MWQLRVEQALRGDSLDGMLNRDAVLTAMVLNAGQVRSHAVSLVDASI